MKVSVLCSDLSHPIYQLLRLWQFENSKHFNVQLCQNKSELTGGSVLFLISCSELIGADIRGQYENTLVIHASDLPVGRGWSPHIWEIINGSPSITVTLLEAEDEVDSGPIWAQKVIQISKDMLWNEINDLLFEAELSLMTFAVNNYTKITPTPQDTKIEPIYYPKRQPKDSQIDPCIPIVEQFDLIRVCDPNRFPAFFYLHGKKYSIRLEKLEHE